jgi:hypothetical protein
MRWSMPPGIVPSAIRSVAVYLTAISVFVAPDVFSAGRCAGGARHRSTTSGGTFGAYLGTLRRNGLIEVDGDGVRASAGLFLSWADHSG